MKKVIQVFGLGTVLLVGGCASISGTSSSLSSPTEPQKAAVSEPVFAVPLPANSLSARRAANAYVPTSEAAMKATQIDRSFQGTELNLDGFDVTFQDTFDRMSVTDENGAGPWYSPVHSDFGAGHFVGPHDGKGPVLVRKGKLVIQMYQENGKWISSNVQSINKMGQGFAQQYGYFETRAKFPLMGGSWTAFWLHSHPALTGPRVPQTEIDVIEAYGGDAPGHHATMHIWPVKNGYEGDVVKTARMGAYTKVQGMFEGFHTYGAMITPTVTIFYYDRKELFRMETKPEFKTPQYVLLDLALLPKEKELASGLLEAEFDYVRVWQKRGGFEDNSR